MVQARADGLVTPAGTARGWRRLVYISQPRKQLPTHLETFDFPQMSPNCLERRDSTVVPQALYLMNNGMVERLADEFAQRVSREAGAEPVAQVERAYWIALSRAPSAAEREAGVKALGTLATEWAKALPGNADPTRQKALATYCHAVVNSAGFLYVD
jgi:hypothetical protein